MDSRPQDDAKPLRCGTTPQVDTPSHGLPQLCASASPALTMSAKSLRTRLACKDGLNDHCIPGPQDGGWHIGGAQQGFDE